MNEDASEPALLRAHYALASPLHLAFASRLPPPGTHTPTPPPSRSRTAGFESKRVDGFECQTSGEAVFELFWSEEALNNVNE